MMIERVGRGGPPSIATAYGFPLHDRCLAVVAIITWARTCGPVSMRARRDLGLKSLSESRGSFQSSNLIRLVLLEHSTPQPEHPILPMRRRRLLPDLRDLRR